MAKGEACFPGFWSRNLLIAGVCEGFWWGDVHVRGHRLVHKGSKANPQVTGELAHLGGQLGAQILDAPQIILHGVRQVHQVVDVYRVILHLPHLDRELLGII